MNPVYIVENVAKVLTAGGVYVSAAQIEASYHNARPWSRSALMNGVREDAATDSAAAVLLAELTALWGPDGLGNVAEEITTIPLVDAMLRAFAEVESL